MHRPKWFVSLPWRSTRQVRDDFDEELAFHIEARTTELVARGLPHTEARALAVRELGDVDDARRYVQTIDNAAESTERRRDIMHDIAYDVRHVIRRLRRSPLFTATAVLSLALATGACALVFNIVTTVLIAPLPYANPDRVVMIWGDIPQVDLGFPELPIHGRYFTDIRSNARVFRSVAAFRSGPFNLETAGDPLRIDGLEATGEFFESLGVTPAIGRFFARENEVPGNDQVVVISDDLWRRSFGADPKVLGRVVTLNARPYTIIGVTPPGFAFPRGTEMPGSFQFAARTELWVPLPPPKRGPSDLALIGRLQSGVTIEQARADLDRVRAIEERLYPQGKGWYGTMTVPLRTQLVGHSRPMLFSLLGAVGLLLLLACVNMAQLQVARLQARRRELAVRAAVGAASGRIALELAVEVLVLVIAGGAIGSLFAWIGVRTVRANGAGRVPLVDTVSFDPRVVFVVLGAAALAGLFASVVPAAFATRIPLVETLRSGGRGATGAAASTRARRWLIAAELALCVVLVASAGLLARSLSRQLTSATGFSAPDGLTFEVTLPATKYPETQQATSMQHPTAVPFFVEALDRLRNIPGVRAAAIGKPLPLSGAQEATVFLPENAPPRKAGEPSPIAQYTIASPQMFEALGTLLIAGRDFTSDDRLESPPVVIVNKSMADLLWPGTNAVGKRIRLGNEQSPSTWMTVVGVSADIKRYSLTEVARPEMTVPFTQNPYPSFLTMQFVVRSSIKPETLLPALRAAVAGVDRTVPLSHVSTIADLVGETTAGARFAARFMAAFGASALALAMIGLYGVVAFSVHQRRQEFGVRRALGAMPGELLSLVVREGAALASAGIGAGVLLAIGAGFAIRHLLYQIPAYDPVSLGGTAVVLSLATLAACLGPAWRASRVDPRAALQEE